MWQAHDGFRKLCEMVACGCADGDVGAAGLELLSRMESKWPEVELNGACRGSLLVPQGITLTIGPGVTVTFLKATELGQFIVRGRLVCQGDAGAL